MITFNIIELDDVIDMYDLTRQEEMYINAVTCCGCYYNGEHVGILSVEQLEPNVIEVHANILKKQHTKTIFQEFIKKTHEYTIKTTTKGPNSAKIARFLTWCGFVVEYTDDIGNINLILQRGNNG